MPRKRDLIMASQDDRLVADLKSWLDSCVSEIKFCPIHDLDCSICRRLFPKVTSRYPDPCPCDVYGVDKIVEIAEQIIDLAEGGEG